MIRVLVVDDSPTARKLLAAIVQSDPELELVGTAVDGEEALRLIVEHRPDVVTLDLMMPRMSGYEVLARLKETGGPPVIVVSSGLSVHDEVRVFQAMEMGAASVQSKPTGLPDQDPRARFLLQEIRAIGYSTRSPASPAPPLQTRPDPLSRRNGVRAVGITASTGGPQALLEVLRPLEGRLQVPVLVVQHIAPGFLNGMARWLGQMLPGLEVAIAGEEMLAAAGMVLLAPDGAHLRVGRGGRVHLDRERGGCSHLPAADPLFSSLARVYGRHAVGVVLTGMGRDGVEGLGELYRRGGYVIAQDRESSVVWGMPGAAVAAGVVHEELPLERIGPRLVELLGEGAGAATQEEG